MKFHTLSFAAGLALSAFVSTASAIALDVSSGSAGFVNTPPAGAFTDVYTFTLPVSASLTGVTTSVVSGGQDIDFTSIILSGPAGSIPFVLTNSDPFEIWTITTPLLSAGAYTLTLVGSNSPGIATYSGNVAISAVPELQTYALFLAGLATVGFLKSRRRG